MIELTDNEGLRKFLSAMRAETVGMGSLRVVKAFAAAGCKTALDVYERPAREWYTQKGVGIKTRLEIQDAIQRVVAAWASFEQVRDASLLATNNRSPSQAETGREGCFTHR